MVLGVLYTLTKMFEVQKMSHCLKNSNFIKEHAIYYLSKKFTNCETIYSPLEKTCCALAWASSRLRQYMLTHTTLKG